MSPPTRERVGWETPAGGTASAETTPHYAIAGTFSEWYLWERVWRQENPGVEVAYLTKGRALAFLRRGYPKGVLHRIGSWESSPAREAAKELEG